MITCIRDVRRAKGLTLADVAARCRPPTTAQTIGRLETGTRTVSVGWLNRIADALGVPAADLVRLPDRAALPLLGLLGGDGLSAPTRPGEVVPPAPASGMVAVRVRAGVGDYRAGDVVWCERLTPDAFARGLNRDVAAPRPAGRFVFGRLIQRDGDRLLILPPGGGTRQQVVTAPAWIALATTLVRPL